MGVVYAARDPGLDRRVAVKLLRPRDTDRRQRLLREAHALARLTHPNVVPVYDAGVAEDAVDPTLPEAPSRIFVAMEFVDGPTLRRWVGERARTWREIVTVAVAAGRGRELDPCHGGPTSFP
jgi:serine/threonine-protein kinase